MVKIVIENLEQKEVLGDKPGLPIVEYIRGAHVDWMQGCGGKGRCTTCRAIVVSGMENLGALTSAEHRYREMKALGSQERLACQATLSGNVVLRIPEDCKLPHLKYTD